jgi:nucleoside-diphosphate-sugar epimerase
MGKVLVTGGAGFVGSHVAEYYAKRGEEVVVLDDLSRTRVLGRVVGDPLLQQLELLRATQERGVG